MKNKHRIGIYSIVALFFLSNQFEAASQSQQENILYIVDSIPILDDPEEGMGELNNEDIEELTVVTTKSEIEKLGFKDIDKAMIITTKEYARRSQELRKIPSTMKMEKKNGKWHLKNAANPYTGPVIDYYLNGKKQGEGIFKDGKIDGLRTVYYPNGQKSFYRHYIVGIENGESAEYFPNGQLKQQGVFKNGEEDGLWKQWYSTGKLKRETQFKEGKAQPTKEAEKFHNHLSKGIQLFKEENYQGAVKALDKAIELNPDYSDTYYHRGTAYFYNFQFEEAVNDYDRALALEPLYKESLANRAFARIRKYEFRNSRTISKNSGVTVLASKDKVEIPKGELELICKDLKKAHELGDKIEMIEDAIKNYCK
jgi:antitoxin component YwqK of YwqJK toxin-antitoxin module